MTLPTGVSRNIPPVRSVSETSAGHHTAHSAGEAPCLLLGLSWPRVPRTRRPSIHRCQLRRGRRFYVYVTIQTYTTCSSLVMNTGFEFLQIKEENRARDTERGKAHLWQYELVKKPNMKSSFYARRDIKRVQAETLSESLQE
ncbi:uncharacterized protein LJ206_001106 [Theristicus caerulescens]